MQQMQAAHNNQHTQPPQSSRQNQHGNPTQRAMGMRMGDMATTTNDTRVSGFNSDAPMNISNATNATNVTDACGSK